MNSYIKPLNEMYCKNANTDNAFWEKKYMRNQFEFFGIRTPIRSELNKTFFKQYKLPAQNEIKNIVYELWNLPQREFQYFALDLLYKSEKIWDKNFIEIFENIIVQKSWWDTVDFIAAKLIGDYFLKYQENILKYTEKWMNSGNIWLQRSALLFQLKYKKNTDFDLLTQCIIKLKESNEFFIQKAIGWILREYSKVEPEKVWQFVSTVKLKPLSEREAKRIILKKFAAIANGS